MEQDSTMTVNHREMAKVYNATFFNKNKDKKFTCELCEAEVSYFNRWHHFATKKHKMALRLKGL